MTARKLAALTLLITLLLPAIAGADESLFDRLDANRDGYINADELDAEKQRLFDRLLRMSDDDGDGQLNRQEFAAVTQSKPQGPELAPAAPGFGGPAAPQFSVRSLLERFDANRDGKLSKDEVPERMRENFARIDANGDGNIDPPELARVIGAPQNPDPRMLDQLFQSRDTNKDGKITVDEVPLERRQQFQRVLPRLDDDGDGALTKQQFLQFATMLAGPQTPGVPQQPGAQGLNGGELAALLRRADTNGDGKISKAEAPERLQRFFNRIDTNQDGLLDRSEVQEAVSQFRQRLPANAGNRNP